MSKTVRFLSLLGLLVPAFAVSAQVAEPPDPGLQVATFAGGCFWCMEQPFDELQGVKSTTVGYTGGETENPSYQQVAGGKTDHVEAVRIIYDPKKVSYEELLDVYWKQIDPTDAEGQFVDRGEQYRTAIFYHDNEQKRLAEKSKTLIGDSGPFEEPIMTEVLPASTFYVAESYHQDYYKKNPFRYKMYRFSSGRDQYLESVWSGARDFNIAPAL